MYEYLEGEVVLHAPARLVVAVGGVGYALSVPLGLPFAEGRPARVWTHLVVREDAHTLYGFATPRQRDLFRLLLAVRGVGPAMALTLLSGLPGERLVEAIVGGDAQTLCRVKGVGKKTAEQILLDLRDRVGLLAGRELRAGAAATPSEEASRRLLADAVAALVSIGYKEKEARKLIERVAEGAPTLQVEELVRAALRG